MKMRRRAAPITKGGQKQPPRRWNKNLLLPAPKTFQKTYSSINSNEDCTPQSTAPGAVHIL
eukprot:5328734-Pleurochrysis_carterae.AAC.1